VLDSILELVYLVDAALALPDLVWISHWEGYSLEDITNETGDSTHGKKDAGDVGVGGV